MDVAGVPDKLDHVPIEAVPRGRLYRLAEPILVDGKPILNSDQYLVVKRPEDLTFDIRIVIEAARDRVAEISVCDPSDASKLVQERRSLLACCIMYFHDIAMIVLIADNIHRGAGRCSGSGQFPVGVPPPPPHVKDLRPSPITAERVMPVSCKAKDLPRGRYLILASSYFKSCAGDKIFLSEADCGSDDADVEISPVVDCFLLKRGELIWLSERGGNLFCTKGGPSLAGEEGGSKRDEFEIYPDCEVLVSIPGSDN